MDEAGIVDQRIQQSMQAALQLQADGLFPVVNLIASLWPEGQEPENPGVKHLAEAIFLYAIGNHRATQALGLDQPQQEQLAQQVWQLLQSAIHLQRDNL
jgi:hypothetical protein